MSANESGVSRQLIHEAQVRRVTALERENRELRHDRDELRIHLARAHEEIRMLRRSRDRMRRRSQDKDRTIGNYRRQNDEMRGQLVDRHRALMDDLCGREPDRPVPEMSRV